MKRIPEKQVIVGTAGHIDHGKTTLVYKLTGIDADRWKEEKERGITIDIGFAHMDKDDLSVSFIDVPGHKDFVTNMLAGVHSIDFAILVVAADESVMPQTKEHFEILTLLGVKNIFPVITKIDLVDEDMLSLVEIEIEELFNSASLKIDKVFRVNAIDGTGIEELKSFLFDFSRSINNFTDLRPPFINIDRSFTIKGYGTVVTGTLMSGCLNLGDKVFVLPLRKSGKIRSINTHGEMVDSICAKKRTALNLPDFKKEEIKRGFVALKDSLDLTTQIVDAKIKIVSGYRLFKDMTRVRVNIGTQDVIARVKLLEKRQYSLPFTTYCQLRFEQPVVCYTGQRFIIRHFSPLFTVGGGVVLDNRPFKRKGYRGIEPLMAKDVEGFINVATAILKEEGTMEKEFLRERLFLNLPVFESIVKELKQKGVVVILKDMIFFMEHFKKLSRSILERVKDFHKKNPRKKGIPLAYFSEKEKSVIDSLAEKRKLVKDGEVVRLPGFKVKMNVEETKEFQRFLSLLKKGGLNPPMMNILKKEFKDEGLLKDIISTLQERGLIVRVNSEFYLYKEHYLSFLSKIRDFALKHGEFTIQDVKPLFNLSRRYLISLLEHLDGEGITFKNGDKRKLIG